MKRIKILGVPQKKPRKISKFYSYIFENKKLLIKSAIYLCCAYQVIQLMIEYTKFKMNTEYRAHDYMKDMAFTFCFNRSKLFYLKPNLQINGKFMNDKNTFLITNRYFRGKYCYSFFVQDNFNQSFYATTKIIFFNFQIVMTNYPYVIYLFGHHNNAPSFFGKLIAMKPKRQSFIFYTLTSKYSIRKLLPSPFKTDCYDYGSLTSEFKSREYCYLNVMRKLELKYCKVNQYWRINVERDSRLKNNITKCITPNITFLNRMCKVDCLDIKSHYELVEHNYIEKKLSYVNQVKVHPLFITYNDHIKKRLYLQYLPKFTRIELFSTLGGLAGMWLGLSI